MTRLLNTPIAGRSAATVDSSRIDMLAELSKCDILRMPPDFWASAGSMLPVAISTAPTTVAAQSLSAISLALPVLSMMATTILRCASGSCYLRFLGIAGERMRGRLRYLSSQTSSKRQPL
jgi:hypothetical protein